MNQNEFFIYHPDRITRLIYADYLEDKGDLFLASVLREEDNVPITCHFKGSGWGFGNGVGSGWGFGDGDGHGDGGGLGDGSGGGYGSGSGDGSGGGRGWGLGWLWKGNW
jgi:hypothetical protein